MKISFITTVFNEEESITSLLDSLNSQTSAIDEVIIVDGGSTDSTLSVISNYSFNKMKVQVLAKKGNRSVGRNKATGNSTGDIILCSDAGCILDKDWVKNITKPFSDSKVDVVAGYYKGRSENIFEKSLIPYVLVMEDKIDDNNFLPATRSMAFKKSIWEKAERFDERLSNNEDYAFARKLKKINAKIAFAKDAIVYWRPRKNLRDSFIMFYRFALGDAESGIIRPKVFLIFLRYFAGFLLVIFYLLTSQRLFLLVIFLILISYLVWAIMKNFRYVRHPLAYLYLPMLQFTSDLAVLIGTSQSLVKRLGNK